MSLRVAMALIGFLLAPSAWANTPSSPPQHNKLEQAASAIAAGQYETAVHMLRAALEGTLSPGQLDRASRMFERLGWIRDARIVADKIANTPSAEPVLRALHTERSKRLIVQEKRAFIRLPKASEWALRYADGELVPAAQEDVDTSPGEVAIELVSKDKRQVWFFLVRAQIGRRLTLDPSVPAVELVAKDSPWRAAALSQTKLATELSDVESLYVPPGKQTLSVRVDDGAPLPIALNGKPGQTMDLTADLEAARRLRDLRLTKEMSVRNQAGPYVTTAVGALIAGAGLALLSVGGNERRQSDSNTLSASAAKSLDQEGRTKETTGGVLLGLGITASVTGLVWYLVNIARGKKAARRVTSDPDVSP